MDANTPEIFTRFGCGSVDQQDGDERDGDEDRRCRDMSSANPEDFTGFFFFR